MIDKFLQTEDKFLPSQVVKKRTFHHFMPMDNDYNLEAKHRHWHNMLKMILVCLATVKVFLKVASETYVYILYSMYIYILPHMCTCQAVDILCSFSYSFCKTIWVVYFENARSLSNTDYSRCTRSGLGQLIQQNETMEHALHWQVSMYLIVSGCVFTCAYG